jgi:hypothetical protein
MSITTIFKPTTFGNDGVSKGKVHGTGATYAACHDAVSGLSNLSLFEIEQLRYGSDGSYLISRFFVRFDTSCLPKNCVINAAKLKIWGMFNNTTIDFYVRIQKWLTANGIVATGTGVETAAYSEFDGVNYDDGLFNTSNWIVGAWNTINITNFDCITKRGHTDLCVRSSRDIDNIPPTIGIFEEIRGYIWIAYPDPGFYVEPQLEITYTPDPPDPQTYELFDTHGVVGILKDGRIIAWSRYARGIDFGEDGEHDNWHQRLPDLKYIEKVIEVQFDYGLSGSKVAADGIEYKIHIWGEVGKSTFGNVVGMTLLGMALNLSGGTLTGKSFGTTVICDVVAIGPP